MPLVSGNFEIRLKVLNEGGESGTILFLTINPSLLLTEYFKYAVGTGLKNV